MSLQPRARLGPYAVSAKIGEGGMGEVWQARDTKLDRDVALKVLPEAFTADPDRLARFERDAKVLASPHVRFFMVATWPPYDSDSRDPRRSASTGRSRHSRRAEKAVCPPVRHRQRTVR